MYSQAYIFLKRTNRAKFKLLNPFGTYVSYMRPKKLVDFPCVSYMRRKRSHSKPIFFTICYIFLCSILLFKLSKDQGSDLCNISAQSCGQFMKNLQKKWKLNFSQGKIRQFVQNGQGRERVKLKLSLYFIKEMSP